MNPEHSNVTNMQRGTYGVDRLAVTLKLDPDLTDAIHLQGKLFGHPNSTQGYIKGLECWAHARWWPSSGNLLLQFNPADLAYKRHGYRLCPFDMVQDIAGDIILSVIHHADAGVLAVSQVDAATGSVDTPHPKRWAEHVTIREIDLARDFFLPPPFQMSHLTDRAPAYSRNQVTISHKQSRGVQTVTQSRTRNTYTHVMYDKWAQEAQGAAGNPKGFPKGAFRFEVKVPRVKVRDNGIETLDRLTDETLSTLLEERWDASRYGQPLVDPTEPHKRILDAHPGRYGLELLGYASASSSNQEISGYTRRATQQMRKGLRSLGINHAKPLEVQGRAYGHLDFGSGELLSDASDRAQPMVEEVIASASTPAVSQIRLGTRFVVQQSKNPEVPTPWCPTPRNFVPQYVSAQTTQRKK